MKKLVLFSFFLVISTVAFSQAKLSVSEGEPALIYSLPKTEFCIEIETEKTIQQPGKFYRYSERYLATANVITEEKTTYRIKNIRVKAIAIPDSTRTYSFIPSKNSQNSHLTVNSQGLLCGINVSCAPKPAPETCNSVSAPEIPKQLDLLPLGEEYMMAGSEAKLAEGAAKQIYRIRDSRLSLLTADVDHMPADGASMTAMLDGLNKLEKQLTELFIGKTNAETTTQTICIVPDKAVSNNVLFRFSALRGVVASDDLSGAPYFYNLTPQKLPIVYANSKSKKEDANLFYVLPIPTQLSIVDGMKTIFTDQYFVPQFGITVPVSEELLKQPKIKVQIDPETGRLLSIE